MGSEVGSGVRVGFKACLRGRPLRRGKVGAGQGASRVELLRVVEVDSGAGLMVASGVGVASGDDLEVETVSLPSGEVGVGGLHLRCD